jgi:phosphoribosyl 1,2-cyclic phosphodiesterase
MFLKILSSSSSGNGYILYNDMEALVIETGVRLSEVKKALDFDISRVVGAIISHEHQDHFKYHGEFLKAGIEVYCSLGTHACSEYKSHHRLFPIPADYIQKIGEFTVLPFKVQHDAREPFGYLINHPETGLILFITDSYFSEYTFAGLNQVILEVNYDPDILEMNINAGKLHPSVRNRIVTSHMGIHTAIELLAANDLSRVNNIVLIHLSDSNSHAENFKKKIESVTGKSVTIADAGTELLINKIPF